MLKKLAVGLIALVIIIGLATQYLWSNLDSLVKSAVEKYGHAATQTTISLDNVKLSLTTGEGSLGGLTIGNPSGFTSATSFYLGLISVKVDPQSIAGSGPITIKNITIDKPQITYEVNGSGDNNLKAILHNAQSYTGTSKKDTEVQSAYGTHNGRKIIIDSLTISNGQIAIIQPVLLKDHPLSTPLPTIHMENIGKNSGGITPDQITQLLLSMVSQSATTAATEDLTKNLGNLKSIKGNLTGAVTNGVGSLSGLLAK